MVDTDTNWAHIDGDIEASWEPYVEDSMVVDSPDEASYEEA